MGQLRLLLLLYYRPLRAMSGIIDEGSLLLATGLVLIASLLTSAATASQVLRALPAQAAQAQWITPGYDVGEDSADPDVAPVAPTGFQHAFLGFFSATSSLSTIFALALLYAPFVLLLLTVFEPIGSFGVA